MTTSSPETALLASTQSASVGLWTPLRRSLFRWLWIATIVSNVGTWMQDVGASWLMTSLAPAPLWVAMVQVATTLPVLLLSIPAGALADIVDRRKLLLGTQAAMVLTACALGAVTLRSAMSPSLLLLLTFVIGAGSALTGPAFQAIVPDLVPRRELLSAISLNSMGFHLARAIGPALGGVVVAATGPGFNFLLNGVSFLGTMIVLWGWNAPRRESLLPPEDLLSAMRAGLRYARHAPALHAVMARGAVFTFGASVVWALLPLVARHQLRLGPQGYGLLLGSMGFGAVIGALILPRIREHLAPDRILGVASLVSAATCFGLAHVASPLWLGVLLVPAGAAWIGAASTVNACAQSSVPSWVRARALSLNLLCIFGGVAFGSVAWGWLAGVVGVPVALDTAAGSLVVGLTVGIFVRLPDGRPLDLRPAPSEWTSDFVADPAPDDGPVLVTIEYRVDPGRGRAFERAMGDLRRVRRRDGAIRWGLWADPATPGRFLESFVVGSWIEHMRQHERVTKADRELQAVAQAFHLDPKPPVVTHYIHARMDEDDAGRHDADEV